MEKLKEEIKDTLMDFRRSDYVVQNDKQFDTMMEHFTNEIVKILNLHFVSNNEVALIDFLFHLNDKGLINNYGFDYAKEAKKYLKKIN